MAHTSQHHKNMKYFVGAEILMLRIEDRKFQGIDHTRPCSTIENHFAEKCLFLPVISLSEEKTTKEGMCHTRNPNNRNSLV